MFLPTQAYKARGKRRNWKGAHEFKQSFVVLWERCSEMAKATGKVKSRKAIDCRKFAIHVRRLLGKVSGGRGGLKQK